MGTGDHGWLKSYFHFSFADYYNPQNVGFGVLRVLNDDRVAPHHGFDAHPHRDMEIVTYVVSGELTHEDDLGHTAVVGRGHVQYMSAGTGIVHGERNDGDEPVRLLQVWILPDRKGHTPAYGDHRFAWEGRENRWLHMVSGPRGAAPVRINQDANFYSLSLDAGREAAMAVAPGRQAYLVQIEGSADINGVRLEPHDALEIVEEHIVVKAKQRSHFLLIEMKKA
jgi:redox-sensitive bicupin YhaK (pirin superfamily)